MTRIKICGLRRPEDIGMVNEVRPEYCGFIFAKGRRRCISPEEALILRGKLAEGISPVGVFVNEDPALIARAARAGVFDLIQLHGQEDEAYIRALREMTDLPVIKAYKVNTKEDVAAAAASPADYILLDHGVGGTGETFDWSLLSSLQRPFFLAGGLNSENVARAITLSHPFAVDVSSGVETDGVKDPDKIRKFVAAVRAADGRKSEE